MEVNFSKNPVIDVESTTVPTPVEGVSVPSITTVAPEAAVAPVAAIPTQPALAVAASESKAVSAHNPTAFDEEDIGYEDIIVPRLNIVQKVGDLSNVFDGGHIVLNQEVSIHTPAFIHPSDPSKNLPGSGMLNVIILGFRRRQYAEKVAGGKLGLLLNSEEEVAAKGGTLNYNEHAQSVEESKLPGGKPALRRFEYLATALVLVEKPAHINDPDSTLFPYECEGKFFQLALWSMKGVSYTGAAKVFFTARKTAKAAFRIKNGPSVPDATSYTDTVWGLTTKLEEYTGGNFAYKPIVRANGKTTPAFRDFCRAIIG